MLFSILFKNVFMLVMQRLLFYICDKVIYDNDILYVIQYCFFSGFL